MRTFLIRGLVRGSPQDRKVRAWLREGEVLAMSTIGWAEFLCGPLSAAETQIARRVIGERLPLTEDDAALGANLFNESGRRRGSLADCLIAATAVGAGASLATADPSDFRRFEPSGLQLLTAP